MLYPMIDYPFQPITWGGEPHDFTSSAGIHQRQLGLYTAELTQRYIPGARSLTWDGRVFKYGKAGVENGASGIVSNSKGAKSGTVLIACKDNTSDHANETVVTDAIVGDTSIKVTYSIGTLGNSYSDSHSDRDGIVAENELCGGYISFYTGNYRQQRGIIGNTESTAQSTSMIIYLDAPLDHILTAGASYCEILANPYMNLYQTNNPWTSIMGMPCVTALVNQYLWLQTWGILRISGTTTQIGTGGQRQWVFDDQGAVIPHITGYNTDDYQHAGFLIERTQTGEAYESAPFIMLQISV